MKESKNEIPEEVQEEEMEVEVEEGKDCPIDFEYLQEVLNQRGIIPTELSRMLGSGYKGQGISYFKSRKWGDIRQLRKIANLLQVPFMSLLKEKDPLPNGYTTNGTTGVVGNGNHIGSVNVNTDLAHENETLKLQVQMLNQLINAKDETIASKNSELLQLRSQKDEITALYEKAMAIFNAHPEIA